VRLVEGHLLCAPEPILVEVREQLGFRISDDDDLRAVFRAEQLEPLDHPLGRVPEGRLGALLDHRAANVQICVARVDEGGARSVGRVRQSAHEGNVLDEPVEHHVLALGDVRSNADRQFGITAQALVGLQAGAAYSTKSAIGCST
jgi:hypothetical protein